MKYTLYLFFLFTFFATGCLDSGNNSPTCQPIDESSFLEENAAREGVMITDSGLQYEVIEEGNGEVPDVGNIIFVEFEGTLTNGTTFVQTQSLDYFGLNDNILPGLFEGISLMDTGSTYRFVIPPELGYDNNPPANTAVQCGSVLIFELTLDSFLIDPDEFLAQNLQREDVNETNSGLQFRVISEGDGEGQSPTPSSTVSVRYKGTFTNGFIFDQSPGNDDVDISLSGVIPGFREGLQLMSPGDKYELFLPSEIGYSDNPPAAIPPGAVLIFEVELVSVLN